MNSKQSRTLAAVFSTPTPSNLSWAAIENLLLALGCELVEGRGSRVRFVSKGVVVAIHRPHPRKEAKEYQVRDVRDFLTKTGVGP